MAFKNIFEKEYDLDELTVDELIWWKDIGKMRIIEATEKCPNNIKNIVTELIKKEFPNPNEIK